MFTMAARPGWATKSKAGSAASAPVTSAQKSANACSSAASRRWNSALCTLTTVSALPSWSNAS
jgi:hypothetical protein